MRRIEDNLVRVARKPLGNYLTAVAMKLKNYDEVKITAFGTGMEKAYELAERAKKLFGVSIESIETLRQKDERGREHSGILILLKKNKQLL